MELYRKGSKRFFSPRGDNKLNAVNCPQFDQAKRNWIETNYSAKTNDDPEAETLFRIKIEFRGEGTEFFGRCHSRGSCVHCHKVSWNNQEKKQKNVSFFSDEILIVNNTSSDRVQPASFLAAVVTNSLEKEEGKLSWISLAVLHCYNVTCVLCFGVCLFCVCVLNWISLSMLHVFYVFYRLLYVGKNSIYHLLTIC